MWFAITIFWGLCPAGHFGKPVAYRPMVYYWFAENEGELPDEEFVFDAFNGYGVGAAIRDLCHRSFSVGDGFRIDPMPKDFDPKRLPHGMTPPTIDSDLEVTICEPSGWSTMSTNAMSFTTETSVNGIWRHLYGK